jgi:hypothetical protein
MGSFTSPHNNAIYCKPIQYSVQLCDMSKVFAVKKIVSPCVLSP